MLTKILIGAIVATPLLLLVVVAGGVYIIHRNVMKKDGI